MTEGFYLNIIGIDESNHGRVPEIFVSVLSTNSGKLLKELSPVKKYRQDVKPEEIKAVNFRHIIYNACHRQIFTDEQLKIISLVEFIKYYERNSQRIQHVIFDGYLSDKNRDILNKTLYPFQPKILIEPKADKNYMLVHDADTIANALYRYYSVENCRRKTAFFDKIVTPRIEDYVFLLEKAYL